MLAALAAAAATLAACGSTSSAGGGTIYGTGNGTGAGAAADAPGSVSTSIGPPGTVGAAHTSLGTILVDAHGRTLYELSVDSPTQIACVGVCPQLWPPYTIPAGTQPMTGGGVAGTLTTVQRPDGSTQIVANGHPLYTYSGDGAAGQTHGEGVQDSGGTWSALSESGQPVMPAGAAATKAPTSSGGYMHY